MTKLIPRTAGPPRPDTRAGKGAPQPGASIPNPRARAAVAYLADNPEAHPSSVAATHGVSLSTLYRAMRAAGNPSDRPRGRRRDPGSPMARALEALRAEPTLAIITIAARHGVEPASLHRAARRCVPPLPNPYGSPGTPRGRKPGSHSEPALGTAGDRYQLRLPEPARAVARHLGATRVRHLFLTVGAALQHAAQDPTGEALRQPLTITLPPVPRPARRHEHARTLALPDPGHPAAPPQTLTARQARAASRAAALAPVDAMATAQGLPALTDTLACLGRVVAACRRLAADGRMPANVGALRDACRLLGVPHLTASPTPREPKAPATARK